MLEMGGASAPRRSLLFFVDAAVSIPPAQLQQPQPQQPWPAAAASDGDSTGARLFDPLRLFARLPAASGQPAIQEWSAAGALSTEQLQTELVITLVRYGLMGAATAAASHTALGDTFYHAGSSGGGGAIAFAASLAFGCAAGVASRVAAVGSGKKLISQVRAGVSTEDAVAATAAAARTAAAASLGLSGSATASGVALRYLSRAANAGALQMMAFTALSRCTAGCGLPEQEHLLMAGALAGAVSVTLSRPLHAALRKPLLSTVRVAAGVLPWRPVAMVAAADVATVCLVEVAAACMGLDPVYCM